jgi:hypothetical protein
MEPPGNKVVNENTGWALSEGIESLLNGQINWILTICVLKEGMPEIYGKIL